MNLLLWTGHVTEELYPVIADIKATGFDGVEIPIFDGDPAHYSKIKKELDNQGLECTTVTVVGPDHSPISPDAKVREAALNRLKWAIDCNHALGAWNMVGPFHSPLGVFSGVPPTEDERKRAADVLRAAAEYAAQAKVQLCVEYLNRFECYFLTTAADAVALVNRVNHPSLKTMYDTFHAHIEEKSQAAPIYQTAPVLGHVHISENDRGTPGTGQVNWAEAFATLKKIGYDGWMVIEAFGRALPDLAAATKVWRDLFPTPKHVYADGLKWIKQNWK
ncbi:sugar phosphate isomerase/epimerase family protein [Zavarzinella formosa]|uniref:sugar phosphate isomerase/epimerase family protein n=1 Tax=Zavarzinella formosa TaxID=360055 RepID=UPI001EE65077|nr:sugar phosphate isomerase/epimerase family protein [Zavarzinella formosa]